MPGLLPTHSYVSFDRKDSSNDILLHLYQGLLKPRLIEEKMLILLRQGKANKRFSVLVRKMTDRVGRNE